MLLSIRLRSLVIRFLIVVLSTATTTTNAESPLTKSVWMIAGKNSLWQRVTLVPLLIAGLGVTPGTRCTEPVELLNVYPTIASMVGLRDTGHVQGKSLAEQINDPGERTNRDAITTHNAGNQSVSDSHFRPIRYVDGANEFYDLRTDLNKFQNAISDPQYAAEVKRLSQSIPVDEKPLPPGSHRRIVERRADQKIYWEGQPIVAGELVK